MSEIAVEQMRSRMLKETEGFLSKKLSCEPRQSRTVKKEFLEYYRRFALRHGHDPATNILQEISL
ncbi:MAG: hypothetical protein VX438_07610 [Planctomycetota bacterium]|nr:hypothetical protein [Planctomycetota bacterium]